jgi:hypothetical protein
MTSFPERLAQAAVAYHGPPPFVGQSDVLITSQKQTGHYRYDPERNGYWVQAEAFVPYGEIDPTSSTTYAVWIAEQEYAGPAPGGNYPGPWVWSSDTSFTCDVVDPQLDLEQANASARRHAHDYARYLRDTYPCAYVAVRPADKGLPLPVRCDKP